MRILVTGGLGLIGHNVARQLQELDHEVMITDICTDYGIIPRSELLYLIGERKNRLNLDRLHIRTVDISNASELDQLMDLYRPEAIIHLASFPRQKVVNANPALGSRVMSEGLLNILESCKKYKVRKIVYTSSSMVYGDFQNFVDETSVCNPKGQYGIMKLSGEWLIRDYAKFGIEHTILRPSAVYGPLDVEDRVISKFLLTAMRGGTLKVNGETETLDFTYVDDAATGIVQATLSGNTANQTYNITKSHSTTLLKAAEMAVALAGSGTIELRSKDIDFPSRGALDITKARKDFGFDPKVDVEEGFQIYFDWLKNDPYWKMQLTNYEKDITINNILIKETA
jgi:nucleoside-diphosphate-sugar epimerase